MNLFKFISTTDPTVLTQGQMIKTPLSIMWAERYNDAGEFELVDRLSSGLREALPIGTLISHYNTLEVMFVENHEIDDDKSEDPIIKISGRSLEAYLENRVVGTNNIRANSLIVGYNLTAVNTWTQLVTLINDHISNPTNVNDNLVNLTAISAVTGITGTIEARQLRSDDLYKTVLDLLSIDNLGIKVIRRNTFGIPISFMEIDSNPTAVTGNITSIAPSSGPMSGGYQIDVYGGPFPPGGSSGNWQWRVGAPVVSHSVIDNGHVRLQTPSPIASTPSQVTIMNEQPQPGTTLGTATFSATAASADSVQSLFVIHNGVNRSNSVIFSWQAGDLEIADYLWTDKPLKNSAMIIGRYVNTYVDTAGMTKFNRKTMVVAADDIDGNLSAPPTGTALTNIVAQMQTRGRQALQKQNRVTFTRADVSDISKYQYRKDYNVGDLVSLDGNFGQIAVMRVVEYVEIQDENGQSGHPTFSLPMPVS